MNDGILFSDDDSEEASVSSLHGSRMERMQILAIWQQYAQDREADTSSLDSGLLYTLVLNAVGYANFGASVACIYFDVTRNYVVPFSECA